MLSAPKRAPKAWARTLVCEIVELFSPEVSSLVYEIVSLVYEIVSDFKFETQTAFYRFSEISERPIEIQ